MYKLLSKRSISTNIDFSDKVVVITGATGGLGRAYAFEFARRGAKVVVNDTGGSLSGGDGSNSAELLVKEIRDSNGTAIADNHSVLDGDKVIDAAIKTFGKCDILINNAGILRDKSFAKMTPVEWRAVIDVHLHGTFSLTHAVWPHMQAANYGRIVNIGSGAGLYGNYGQANYSAAKMGILGLTNTLALEGAKHNILVNCVVPVAASRMTETVLPASLLSLLNPIHVVPLVTFLSSNSCSINGSCFEVGGGWYSQVRIQRSKGVHLGSESSPASAESIASNIARISDFSHEASYPTSPADAITQIASTDSSQVPPDIATPTLVEDSPPTAVSEVGNVLDSDELFHTLQHIMQFDSHKKNRLVELIGAAVLFEVSPSSSISSQQPKLWLLDLRSQEFASVTLLKQDSAVQSQVRISCSDSTLLRLSKGSLSAEGAYLSGQLRVKGRMSLALKVKALLEAARVGTKTS